MLYSQQFSTGLDLWPVITPQRLLKTLMTQNAKKKKRKKKNFLKDGVAGTKDNTWEHSELTKYYSLHPIRCILNSRRILGRHERTAVIILHLPHHVQYACIVAVSSSLKIQGIICHVYNNWNRKDWPWNSSSSSFILNTKKSPSKYTSNTKWCNMEAVPSTLLWDFTIVKLKELDTHTHTHILISIFFIIHIYLLLQ